MAKGFDNYFSEVGALLAVTIESLKENTFNTITSKKTIFIALFQPNKSCRSF